MSLHQRIYDTKIPSMKKDVISTEHRKNDHSKNTTRMYHYNTPIKSSSNTSLAKNPRAPCFKSSVNIKKGSNSYNGKIPIKQSTFCKTMHFDDESRNFKEMFSQHDSLKSMEIAKDSIKSSSFSPESINDNFDVAEDNQICCNSSTILTRNDLEDIVKIELTDEDQKLLDTIEIPETSQSVNISKKLPTWYPGFFSACSKGEGSSFKAFRSNSNPSIRFAWYLNNDR